jgi:hypothetical protein
VWVTDNVCSGQLWKVKHGSGFWPTIWILLNSYGKSIGAVWTMKLLAERTHVSKSLGNTAEAKLALLQVITRVIDQGSRLSAVRFAKRHAICEILGITKLDEDDLYENLSWLAYKQEEIEKKLFVNRFPDKKPTLFLYDVTRQRDTHFMTTSYPFVFELTWNQKISNI